MLGRTPCKKLRLLPRKTMHFKAGPPVDLSEFAGRSMDTDTLRLVTEKIMTAITVLLEELRGEQAPAVRFDPRAAGLPPTGDPRRIDPGKRRSA